LPNVCTNEKIIVACLIQKSLLHIYFRKDVKKNFRCNNSQRRKCHLLSKGENLIGETRVQRLCCLLNHAVKIAIEHCFNLTSFINIDWL
jgi:hypothetical protein